MTDNNFTALVPDTEELLSVLHRVDDPLIAFLLPIPDLPEDEEGWQMPATLDVQAVEEAWSRMLGALPLPLSFGGRRPDDGEELPGSYRLLAGVRGQQASLYPVTVARADLDTMIGLLDHLRQAIALPRPDDVADLAEVLDQVAEHRTEQSRGLLPRHQAVSAADVVQELALALDLLGTGEDADAQLLLDAVGTPVPGSTVSLAGEQAAAYDRWTGHLIRRVAADPLDAALIRFTV